MNALLEAALQYEQLGWFVLPLNETVKAKMPRVKWKHRRDKRPDAAEIRAWWTKWPNANVGIATGEYSGVDVLDFDGAETVEQVEAATGATIDRTYSVTTGRSDGGLHVYYRHNPNNGLKNWAKAIPGISVDTRTTDGIVAAPPSVHHSGAVYKWNGHDPKLNGANFKQIPPQVLMALDPKAKQGPPAAPTEINGFQIPEYLRGHGPVVSDLGPPPSTLDREAVERGVPEGERDQLVFQLLCSLRARGAMYEEALQQALALGARCSPPFPREEVVAKIDHVWSSYPAGTASVWNTPPDQAQSRLDAVKQWVKDTPDPQHGWLDQIHGLIPEDINIIIDMINDKTRCGKRALQQSLALHNARTCSNTVPSVIEKLNDRYGWTTIGANAYIIDTERKDKLKIIKSKTFIEQYSNQRISIPAANGETRSMEVGKAWLQNPKRRDFKGVYFHPAQHREGWYNLYQGFAVKPAKTVDFRYIEKYMWHVNNIICSKEIALMDYIWAWAADMYQVPADKKGVAVILRGGKGTGKGFFVKPLLDLWGHHAMNIINPGQFTGRFNSHLANKILMYIDEAFWTGSRREAEGVVKGLITEATIAIEAKGVDVVSLDNFNKFIMASNQDWAVPASFDERRFCCIDVSPVAAQNTRYFAHLKAEMDHPMFLPTLLRYLLDYQYDTATVRHPPTSKALTDQKLHGLEPAQAWWYELLQSADNSTAYKEWVDEGQWFKTTEDLHSLYIQWCQERRKDIASRQLFAQALFGKDGLCRSAERKRSSKDNRPWGYLFPSIDVCRSDFEKTVRGTIKW